MALTRHRMLLLLHLLLVMMLLLLLLLLVVMLLMLLRWNGVVGGVELGGGITSLWSVVLWLTAGRHLLMPLARVTTATASCGITNSNVTYITEIPPIDFMVVTIAWTETEA